MKTPGLMAVLEWFGLQNLLLVGDPLKWRKALKLNCLDVPEGPNLVWVSVPFGLERGIVLKRAPVPVREPVGIAVEVHEVDPSPAKCAAKPVHYL